MLDLESSIYFMEELVSVYRNKTLPLKKRILILRPLLREFFDKLLENENRFFSTSFSKAVYLIDKYNVPAGLASEIKKIRYFTTSILNDQNFRLTEGHLYFCMKTFTDSIIFFNDELSVQIMKKNYGDFIDSLSSAELRDPEYKPKTSGLETVDYVRAVVREKVKAEKNKDKAYAVIECYSDDPGPFRFYIKGFWLDAYKTSWEGAVLNIFDVKIRKDSKGNITLFTTPHTLIVLEPDYLIDVTDIAECFQSSGPNKYLYLLKRFTGNGTSLPLLLGNVVNSCLDELLLNPEISFEEAYDKAIVSKYLQALSLAFRRPEEIKILKARAETHFENLKNIINEIDGDIISVEPSFISPDYGLQGRLDVLIEYSADENKKDIIELKSGNPPTVDLSVRTQDGVIVKTGIWHNNIAQVTCYNLLLDTVFRNRTGSSHILYSGAGDFPLRNTPNIIQKKREVLNLRNWIVALEKALIEGHYASLGKLNPSKIGNVPPFIAKHLTEFAETYISMSELEREYFHIYISFILREMQSGRNGGGDNARESGFSSLWRNGIDEKKASYSILTGLMLDEDNSDFNGLHIHFQRADEDDISSFRKGDIALIYPAPGDGVYLPAENQLLKCVIKEITPEQVIISLRNKLFSRERIINHNEWVMEADYIETSGKKLFRSVFEMMAADERKKKIFLGMKKPEFGEIKDLFVPELNANQNEIMNNALAAKDYFLIQGPPGTGKTSYMLKNIVRWLHENTDENILVLAYTNRAVDEIISALKKISPELSLLRLGSRESSEHQDCLISCIAGENSMRDVFLKVRDTRIILSTVISALTNPEIFDIKKFDIAIIDEASQVLEPHLAGILSKTVRFIMIGDEKQLPAIVTQPAKYLNIDSALPDLINLNNPASSLFERLLKCCMANNWDDAYGMLRSQARMHENIQGISNILFYNGMLETFPGNEWQISDDSIFLKNSDNRLEKMLAESRIVFFESKSGDRPKVNIYEADLAVQIIEVIRKAYGEKFSENTVGVISPFRAQCSEIRKRLPSETRDMVTVDTVERFQGSERDIIIISFAVNNEYLLRNISSETKINGTVIDRKLNVAITRAKKQLIFMGNTRILKKNPVYNELMEKIRITTFV